MKWKSIKGCLWGKIFPDYILWSLLTARSESQISIIINDLQLENLKACQNLFTILNFYCYPWMSLNSINMYTCTFTLSPPWKECGNHFRSQILCTKCKADNIEILSWQLKSYNNLYPNINVKKKKPWTFQII